MNGFPEKVLLATDGLENTTLAARAAVDLAKKGEAELHVVHAWHTVPSPHFDRVIRSGLEDAGREALEEQVHIAHEQGRNPDATLQAEYEQVVMKLQSSPVYQRLVSAQSNFDRIVQRVNQTIAKGLEEGASSRIILPA